MTLSPEQVKGRIKSLAKRNNADPITLMRMFMMEKFLERISNSKYADNFIIKGGMLVSSMIGVAMRSTMDIDATLKNYPLSEEEASQMIRQIASVDLEDGISFQVTDTTSIMDDFEYPGLRFMLNAIMGGMSIPIKIDISTGDVITPREISYEYKMMLEEKSISLWSYNLETILSEKLEAVLSKGLLNTRMRDFYDIHTLQLCYGDRINTYDFKNAFEATCNKRGCSYLLIEGRDILRKIVNDKTLHELWEKYRNRYSYAKEISFNECLKNTEKLLQYI